MILSQEVAKKSIQSHSLSQRAWQSNDRRVYWYQINRLLLRYQKTWKAIGWWVDQKHELSFWKRWIWPCHHSQTTLTQEDRAQASIIQETKASNIQTKLQVEKKNNWTQKFPAWDRIVVICQNMQYKKIILLIITDSILSYICS